jgi:hypothetical protein
VRGGVADGVLQRRGSRLAAQEGQPTTEEGRPAKVEGWPACCTGRVADCRGVATGLLQ